MVSRAGQFPGSDAVKLQGSGCDHLELAETTMQKPICCSSTSATMLVTRTIFQAPGRYSKLNEAFQATASLPPRQTAGTVVHLTPALVI